MNDRHNTKNAASALIIGICLILGLSSLGFLLGQAAIKYREYERTVTVKGLAEREDPADIVIWPIQFTVAGNQLDTVYNTIDANTTKIKKHLQENGIEAAEISAPAPSIIDKSAQRYGNQPAAEFRYTATQTITVYSQQIDRTRAVMGTLSSLGKSGIVFSSDDYQAQTEYLFTRLNEIKPAMIEEATKEARAVAEKFAADSNSRLGKIKQASQGQFSISDRDKNNPHIKKVRVVSTVEYYLSD